MEYTTLGNTGITVSRICLGCGTFGGAGWTLDEDASGNIIDRAIDLGINFFDTANLYSFGSSERLLGTALAEYDRDRFVVQSKGYYQIDRDNPNAGGLSRKALAHQLQASLDRLDMDTLDLYYIHRWDDNTVIEHTLRALDRAVMQGKTRYIGASSMWAYQLLEALYTSDRLNMNRFVAMQNHYNLVYREEEREMLPVCKRNDIGVTTWSPLARGYLARPHSEIEATERGQSDTSIRKYPYREGNGPEINARVQEIAENTGVSMAQISLAWLLHKDWVDAPVVGTTSIAHLEDAVEAVDITLSSSDMRYLEEPYTPVRVTGHGDDRPDDYQ